MLEYLDDIIFFISKPPIITLLISATTAIVTYIATKLKTFGGSLKKSREENYSLQCSIKRSSLRCEYLEVYNSENLTIKEKYDFTRTIYNDYKRLGGNHYIDELDAKIVDAYNKYVKGVKAHAKH